ncbi:MAG: sigma-70 family RNA polymerase sigma factor [Ignavibacteriales bacterium]|nr:sigma-70 family RNA polymerase sigma factor [Ignavibacteriales bacterium]
MALEDHELIHKAQRGDRVAFEQLVYRYDNHVLSLAAKYTNNRDDAKDIYQEVFIRVFKSLKNFEGRSEFSTWLFRITTNVCLTYKTRNSKRSHASLDYEFEGTDGDVLSLSDVISDTTTSDQHTINEEISANINEAMNALSPQQKMVFSLRHYHGYKLKEIAEMMNCAEGTVKKYLFTATQKMREQLREIYQ